MQEDLLSGIREIEDFAKAGKFYRFLRKPVRYTKAILFKEWIYPLLKKEWVTKTKLFFGGELYVALPASTDIYLTGCKTHPSETRLVTFLLKNVKKGKVFWDIGAHYGFFTLLAAHLVGEEGQVTAFEPSAGAFELLTRNTASVRNINRLKKGVADRESVVAFYEFPNLFSEYNSARIEQFEKERWIKKNRPEKTKVEMVTIDGMAKEGNRRKPDYIKIDAEGFEEEVIAGAVSCLATYHPVVIMEYASPGKGNLPHQRAVEKLREYNYQAFRINRDGHLERLDNVNEYLKKTGMESDNIVFQKTGA